MFVHAQFKPKTPEDIDKVISAEIPDKVTNPDLFDAVQKYMVHGPCGHLNTNSPCMSNKKCTKHFPKEFKIRTNIDEGGFPKYRRRDDGRVITKKKCTLDNRYIVPYNPWLLLKYKAHINVEYTCQTSAIKYLFKYVHKGNDRVTTRLFHNDGSADSTKVVDEIKNYYDCRYVSACEAAWRLFEFDIHYREPAVVRLPFHLENEESVIYKDYEKIDEVIERAESKKSMFLGWMEANKIYEEARNISYVDFPTKFVWKKDQSKWTPRKQGFSIGRISHMPPSGGQDFYLRLLLNVQKGCTSYEDIKKVNGIICKTFQEACFSLGLLEDDKEFVEAIKEASYWASAYYLRRLFAVLLISKNMTTPQMVWNKCWKDLSDDILYNQRKRLGYKGTYFMFNLNLLISIISLSLIFYVYRFDLDRRGNKKPSTCRD